jgi:hypothetical protein
MLLLSPVFASAQTEMGGVSRTWSYPVVYNYDEQVTWYFDLSASAFVPGQDIYLWIWSPSEPDAGNWGNSSEFAKLTYLHDKIWSFTLTPTVYFSRTPAEIAASAGFWFRLKDKTGSQQSDVTNLAYTSFASFATDNQLIRSYPEHPKLEDGLSILFNANLAPGFGDATSVHFHSGLNNWDLKVEYQAWIPEIVTKTQLKNLGGGIYKMDLVPKEYYAAPDGYIMQNLVFLMVKDNWAGTIPDQMLTAAEYVPPPPPVFTFFPSQISQKDFLGIKRVYNEPGITKLIYTVTAGTVVLTGEFVGGTAEIKGFVDLVSGLRNAPGVTQIHVLVKDNTDRTISDTNIPLKTVD